MKEGEGKCIFVFAEENKGMFVLSDQLFYKRNNDFQRY